MCPSSPALVVAPVKSPDIGVSALLTWAQESNLTGGLTGGCDGANGDHKQDCIVLQCFPYYTGPSKKSWAASNSARALRTVRVTDHEWPEGLREASRGPFSKPRGKRTWFVSEIPVQPWRMSSSVTRTVSSTILRRAATSSSESSRS